MSRRSARLRVTRSKYFVNDESEIFDTQEVEDKDNDSDYDPMLVEDTKDHHVGTKSRKRKSTNVANGVKKGKQPTKRSKKRKTEHVEDDIKPDSNNNHEPAYNLPSTSNTTPDMDSDSDDDGQDWEEVEDAEIFDMDNYQPTLPSNLKITVEKPKKEKKPGDWIEAYIRQEINRIRKKIQLDTHKCHLLLLIYRLQYLNSIANDPTVKALVLSVIPAKFGRKPKEPLAKFISKLKNWLNDEFKVNIDNTLIDSDLYINIVSSFETKSISSPLVMVLILVAILRVLSFHTRLCYFLNPVSIKASNLLSKKKSKKVGINSDSRSNTPSSSTSNEQKQIGESSSDSDSVLDWQHSNYYWIEIFDESKKKWNCFDFVNDLADASSICAQPDKTSTTYILAIDNDDYVNEITAKYAPDWVSYAMKKRRIESPGWWEETLEMLRRPEFSVYDDADKKEIDQIMAKVELPKRLSDFKNHPLFVLQRDILKFQAIYPPDAPTLGFFRDQPVFARDCVHTLKSRETWLRVARTVKLGEDPYKIVPSKFKRSSTGQKEMLDLFGEWQTEPYVPPVAKDGIVPRNAFGNVELFQASMLPKGTVHLKLPGLMRLAQRLDIDCVPAVVGFDCNKNSRGAHPVTDGFVVCSEFESVLVDAWNQEQVIIQEKEKKKREKRIYDNWKRLIKGLIIRQKLKIKYG